MICHQNQRMKQHSISKIVGPSFLISMVPGAIHSPISGQWNWLQGYVFRLFTLSQQWQAHHSGQTRALRISPQDKRKTEERWQQKIKAGSHMPQVHLWSWWVLKYCTPFSYYLPINCIKCVLVWIWIIHSLLSITSECQFIMRLLHYSALAVKSLPCPWLLPSMSCTELLPRMSS